MSRLRKLYFQTKTNHCKLFLCYSTALSQITKGPFSPFDSAKLKRIERVHHALTLRISTHFFEDHTFSQRLICSLSILWPKITIWCSDWTQRRRSWWGISNTLDSLGSLETHQPSLEILRRQTCGHSDRENVIPEHTDEDHDEEFDKRWTHLIDFERIRQVFCSLPTNLVASKFQSLKCLNISTGIM